MKNKKIIISIIVFILILGIVYIVYNIQEKNKQQLEQQAIAEQQRIDEEKKQEEIENKEKPYSENSKYQCFKDDAFNVRFYYDTENLTYGSLIAQRK